MTGPKAHPGDTPSRPWPPTATAVVGDVVVAAADEVHEPGWVGIDRGAIVAVGGGAAPAELPVLARGDLVMPGLVSTHQHLVDALVRGGPTGPTFLDWLLATYHAGLAHARPEGCEAAVATLRAAALAAGTTTVVDCWSVGPVTGPDASRSAECADASVEAHLRSGGRTVFAAMFVERPAAGWDSCRHHVDPARLCRPADEALSEVERLDRRHRHGGHGCRLVVTPSPELPEAVTPEGFRSALALAERLGAALPVHLCASPPARAAYGPEDLDRDGVLDARLLGAHVSAVDGPDIAVLGRAGIGLAHCPSAARALGADQLTPLAALRRAGARAGLGLDNASLHPGRDLFEEARQARLASVVAGDPVDPVDLFRVLTSEGASAAGLGDVVGALRPGRRADLLVLTTSGAHWWPRAASWPATVVERASAADVAAVVVDGRVVARGGVAAVGGDGAALDRANRAIRSAMAW